MWTTTVYKGLLFLSQSIILLTSCIQKGKGELALVCARLAFIFIFYNKLCYNMFYSISTIKSYYYMLPETCRLLLEITFVMKTPIVKCNISKARSEINGGDREFLQNAHVHSVTVS